MDEEKIFAIEAVLPNYIGEITQRPPAFSAIKIDGKRAYDLARQGEAPEMPERQVHVVDLQLLDVETDQAHFEMTCGKGTYVRSLARDIAIELGTYGHLTALRRTRVGPFDEAQAFSLDKLEEMSHIAPPEKALLPLVTPLDDIPEIAVMDSEADRLRSGQTVRVPQQLDGEVIITCPSGPVAMGWLEDGELKPKRVFNL